MFKEKTVSGSQAYGSSMVLSMSNVAAQSKVDLMMGSKLSVHCRCVRETVLSFCFFLRRLVCCVVVVVVSHIQRIGCQPEKTTLHGGQSRPWSAEQGKENKRKSLNHDDR